MTSSSRKFYRSQWLNGFVVVVVMLLAGGSGDLCAQTDTEHNAKKTLSDLQIDVTAAEPNITIPEIYTTPPKIIEQIVGGTPEFKLFYFCRHHTSDELKKIVHEQFATKIFDKKGKETKLVDYTVSSNPATNQLIVRCPAREDVDAVLEFLEAVDVPPIQVKIECLISDIYADKTFDRETTIAIENLFGENVTMKPGGTAFGANVQELVLDDESLPAFPGASLRELVRARMGLKIGYLSTTHDFTALVDLLESRGYLKILMSPILETINGKTAIVKSTQNVPLQTVTRVAPGRTSVGGAGLVVTTEIEYKEVIDSLEITPHVYSDGYIGLETKILLGAKNTPHGVKQVPIITTREITSKENRIRPGESLIIGGMRKTVEFGVVRGVPILKDIPLIGFLFSGEDTEQRAVETVFILTPTYSTGGRPKEEVMEEVRKKHEPSSPGGLQKTITDFFGDKSGEEEEQRKADEAEKSLLEAKSEKSEARSAVREAASRSERSEAEAQKATSDAAKTKADADKLMAEAKKLIAEAEAKTKAAETATTDATKTKAEAEKLAAEAKKAKAGAQKSIAQADKKAKAAEAAKAAADKMIAVAKKAQAETETAKAKANAKARAAEKAKQEAEKAKATEQQAKAETEKTEERSEAKTESEKPKEESGKAEVKAETEESKEDAEKAKAEEDNAEPEA